MASSNFALKLIRWLIIAALLACCGWLIYSMIVVFLSEPISQQNDTANIEQQNVKKQQKPAFTLKSINELDLFGTAESDDKRKEAPEAISAPETKLNIKLKGLRLDSDNAKSSAIIEDKNRVQKVYKQGDEIEDNVLVHQIYAQHLILKHNGRYETLTLFEVLKQQNRNNSTVESANSAPISDEVAEPDLSLEGVDDPDLSLDDDRPEPVNMW